MQPILLAILQRILLKLEQMHKTQEENQKRLCKVKETLKSIKEEVSVLSFDKEYLNVNL